MNVYGSDSPETINADDGVTNGADTIFGYGGNDTIFGLGGNDEIKGGGGADAINGGSGTDTSNYSDSASGVTVSLESGMGFGGTAQGDTLTSIENLTGSSHEDFLIGNAGNNVLTGLEDDDILKGGGGADTLYGDSGNDTLKGGGGADTLNGGSGIDTASYFDSSAGVFISLITDTAAWGDAEDDELNSIENVTGSAYNDQLWGNDGVNVLKGMDGVDTLKGYGGNDTLLGGDGNDSLYGMDGIDTLRGENGGDALNGGANNDVLIGGAGSDTLAGGSGADAFRFDAALNIATNIDTITDFSVAQVDTILLDDAIFTNLSGTVGNSITFEEFRIGAVAQDANDHIIYNDVTGALFYDADGVGGAAAVQFATLSPGLALTNGLIGII
jgi:Ca2+-binding RTX toxin-like protein